MSLPNYSLEQALTHLKEGKTFLALKSLEKLVKSSTNKTNPEYLAAIQNYQLALNLIFDRKLAIAEELYQQENEIATSIVLLNLSNLFLEFGIYSSKSDKNLQKKGSLFFDLVEKWALKVFTIIKSTELRKRHLERRFTEVFTSFSIISNLFLNYFIPLMNDFYPKKYDSRSLLKTIQSIYREFGNFYLKEAEKKLADKNIVKTHQILTKCKHIANLVENDSKLQQQITIKSQQNAELAADFELVAGRENLKKKMFQEALLHFRNAHFQYKILKINSKQKQAKEEYLQASIYQIQEEVKQAEIYKEQGQIKESIQLYHKCIDQYEKINAQHELSVLRKKFAIFQTKLGDEQFERGNKVILKSIQDIDQAKNFYSNAERYYIKAEDSKKLKEVKKIITRLSKMKMKFLQKNAHSAGKARNYELEFLYLEEMHMICYEIEDASKAQDYARQLEKLRKKINLQKVEQMREQMLTSKPWLASESSNSKQKPEKINIPINNHDENLAPTMFQDNSAETIAFFDPSNNLNDKTYFTDRILQKRPTISKSEDKSEEVKNVYKIVKKFNSSLFLTNSDIHYLISFGVNLPQDIYYYHKFAKSFHQFYVHISASNLPKVLLIPTKNLIKRQAYLGTLAYTMDIFIPINTDSTLSTDLLKDQIYFAINHPNWEPIMEGFQYSTLDCYFYFLHACRLIERKAPHSEVAKYLNSSVIAEFLNVPTDRLEQYLADFQEVKFFEEIMSWSDNPNFQLFFMGLYFYQERRYDIAASIWCMMIVG
ncbi:hypothetical protein NEF87_005049 [Candidatus Lokiarchaeum ossiferum]|uniref:Tetratricopeptide repeat protein n=1 Tax=Candidatus Lokiarchaeum ossiferum TaxID=2951803 RepID=A0ABY6I265_9ARCH|nr:hypothetical protein NEF87_005049 [Candidatus Lokiarchaeum sp. B-35]